MIEQLLIKFTNEKFTPELHFFAARKWRFDFAHELKSGNEGEGVYPTPEELVYCRWKIQQG